MIIKVDERGELKVDSNVKSVEQFDQEFLEGLVEKSLAGEVEYEIEGATPIAQFFKAIKEGTAPDSDLKKLQEEVASKEAAQNAHIDVKGEVPEGDAVSATTSHEGSDSISE